MEQHRSPNSCRDVIGMGNMPAPLADLRGRKEERPKRGDIATGHDRLVAPPRAWGRCASMFQSEKIGLILALFERSGHPGADRVSSPSPRLRPLAGRGPG